MSKVSAEVGSRLCGSKGSNDLRPGGVRSDAAVVGSGPLAFSGCTVCVCAQPLRNGMSQGDTGRMASFSLFPFEERGDGPQSVGLVWAQHPSRSSESMCLGQFAHDGGGEFLAVGQWLLGFVEQLG